MKRTTLTPPLKSLKIAIASAILGLGAMSGANAQLDSIEKKLQQKFQGLDDNKIAALKKDDTFSILSLMMAANTLTIDEINKDVIKNNNSIQDLDDEMNFLSEDITSLNDDVADIQANIAENNDSIDDLYEANAENVERLIQVDDNVFVNRLNIQELKRKQENDIKDVVGMQNAIAEQADINKNDIQDLAKAQLAGVTVMEELNKNVEENKADIANNNTTLAQHTKQINENKQAIEAKLGGKVDAQKLVDLEKKVKKNQDKVDERLATVQENYSQQVQSVDNKIGMVDTRVNALDDKVENSMAAQAALNGLFQPYNVGKVSVSVAVGAYGSKSAIAVGAGYRVNPHLAFKGGAAINTSGSRKGSYNLGINYEF